MSVPNATAPLAGAAGSAPFHVGDAVTWTHCRSNGRSIQFSTRTGFVLEIVKAVALCKRHRAQAEWVRCDRLRHAGTRSELNELVMEMATPLSRGVSPNAVTLPPGGKGAL